MAWLVALAAVALLAAIWLWKTFENTKTLIELYKNYHRLNDWISEQCRLRGSTWQFTIPVTGRFIITVDPVNIEHILRGHFDAYYKGPRIHQFLHDMMGDGIFNTDGQHWYVQRKTASMIFNVRNFRDFYCRVFQEHLILVDRLLMQASADQCTIDWHWLMHRFTLQSFCKIGFSKDLRLLDDFQEATVSSGGRGCQLTFSDAFDRLQNITDTRIFNPIWPVTEWLSGTAAEVGEYKRIMQKFSADIIRERRDDGVDNNDDCNDLLSYYLAAKADDSGRSFNDSELHDVVMNMIIAGRDTTAQLLSWCIYRLHQHPQVKQRIRQEVREVLGAEFDPMEDVELLDYETVTKRLPYTRAFAMETLRLHPSVPKQAKECAVDHDYLPDGTLVQRGDRVTYVSYAMGRSAQLWDDPDRFDPERFLKDPQPSQYKFIAFNAGPRICLGMNLAYMETIMALVCFVSKYDIQLIQPSASVTYQNALTLPMRGGLPVRIVPATVDK